ncbi:MAG: hypothetical protein AAF670_13640 [Planctomycetota bacterium]
MSKTELPLRTAVQRQPWPNWTRSIIAGILMAAVMEMISCFMRFGLGYESTRDTSFLAALTFGCRLHHGYFGVLTMLLAMLTPNVSDRWRAWLMAVGIGLFVSDLVHHFLVLWPITGSPEFDLVYPSS